MHYPKPGQVGGQLIREVVSFCRNQFEQSSQQQPLPISTHILIAVSGGSDSVALAALLIKYGRRVGPRSQIRILHINHRWRGEESDRDELFVRELAKQWKVPISIVRLKPPNFADGDSLEDKARTARARIFQRYSTKYHAPVFTAHHADDLAETMLWRLFTGNAHQQGGGISFQHGCQIRPLLRVKKKDLLEFLKEEKLDWREDPTNHEGRFLRSRLRQEAMPLLEKLFPRMVDRLVEQALASQKNGSKENADTDPSILFQAAGIRMRRNHFQLLKEIQERVKNKTDSPGGIDLPGGWRLGWKRSKQSFRWTLERVVPVPVPSGKTG